MSVTGSTPRKDRLDDGQNLVIVRKTPSVGEEGNECISFGKCLVFVVQIADLPDIHVKHLLFVTLKRTGYAFKRSLHGYPLIVRQIQFPHRGRLNIVQMPATNESAMPQRAMEPRHAVHHLRCRFAFTNANRCGPLTHVLYRVRPFPSIRHVVCSGETQSITVEQRYELCKVHVAPDLGAAVGGGKALMWAVVG